MGKGASPVGDRAAGPTDPSQQAVSAKGSIPSASDGRHPYYGGCDGFGPFGMCSECTGIVHRVDGTLCASGASDQSLDKDEAATLLRSFLLREAGCAALAAAMHTSEPIAVCRFVEDWMGEILPRSFAATQASQ